MRSERAAAARPPLSLGVLLMPVGALVVQQLARLTAAAETVSVLLHVAALLWLVAVAMPRSAPVRAAALLACIGGGLNIVAIAASGGRMPVTANAMSQLVTAGKADNIFRGHVVVEGGIGSVIGDTIAVPWLHLVASPGDVLMVVAALILLAHLALRRTTARMRGAHRPAPSTVASVVAA